MRTVILTVDPAAPPVSGAELRNWQNASVLAEFGRVTLVSLRPMAGPPHLLDDRIECAALTGAGEGQSPGLVKRRSSIDVRMTGPALARLMSIADRIKPDAVLVEGIPLCPFLPHLRPITPMLILDMHNIESDVKAQTDPRPSSLSILFGSDADRIRRLEKQAIDMVDRVWTCSENDRERLRNLFGAEIDVAVVPNGIPRPDTLPAALPAAATGAERGPVLLFVGHLGYAPNVAAVGRLATHVLPLVLSDFPAARLIVAGRSPADDLLAVSTSPAIEIIADPPDLSELYRRAHVAVVPLLSGGGTRIKILEAMAHGLPVVATPLAVEGLGLVDGKDVLLADQDRALADHIRTLCSDPERRERLRQHARLTVTTRFGPAAIAAAVRDGIAAPR